MPKAPAVLHVAVPTPLYRTFDYLAPAPAIAVGARVRVPFGRRELVGVVLSTAGDSELPRAKLKHVRQVLDDTPLLSQDMVALLGWTADYYHHPIGEVFATALPVLLRQGRAATAQGERVYRLTDAGRAADVATLRAASQRSLLAALARAPEPLTASALAEHSAAWSRAVQALMKKGLVAADERPCLTVHSVVCSEAPVLNAAQQAACAAIAATPDTFQAYLLHGITGSGKTEVYLQAIAATLARGRQALVLVPEIALTPQVVARFRARFAVPIAVLHSGLTETERLCAWLAARDGLAPIVLGTRSAAFTPLPKLGLVIVDEEHDASYKQQDGLRYSARDVAVYRASRAKVPIVLGSASPSLESVQHARAKRYRLLELPERAGAAALPEVQLLDMRRLKSHDGLSPPLRASIAARLARGEQTLLFLNRRGFSPVWMCHGCGWLAPCARCDARLVYHRGTRQLRCHHCGAEQPVVEACPSCGGAELKPLGEGTERIETALTELFPQARIERIDRDTVRRKGELEAKLEAMHAGHADILVGTQMLTKGHDFPNVTLVGVLNADQGLYSSDFHATERLFQQILQVSGRAGRADKPGQVLIQTWHPQHALFAALVRHDFNAFVEYALAERRETDFPPFSYLALLRAEAATREVALRFLRWARAQGTALAVSGVSLSEPLPAPMERRGGRFRAQLLVQASERRPLHRLLGAWVRALSETREARAVRWSLDVDPVDLY
jgi:primosomal protein N' (replication factor Y)